MCKGRSETVAGQPGFPHSPFSSGGWLDGVCFWASAILSFAVISVGSPVPFVLEGVHITLHSFNKDRLIYTHNVQTVQSVQTRHVFEK